MSYDQPPPPARGGDPYGAPQYGGPPAQDPGRTMGIVGLVLAIFCSLIGLVVSIIAFNKSKAGRLQEQHRAGRHHRRRRACSWSASSINFTVYMPMMQR